MKILIIGASGFLGTKLTKVLGEHHDVVGTDISRGNCAHLDATRLDEVLSIFEKYKPDVVIDTVALTSSVRCEKNPKLAKELNFITAKNIAQACKEYNAKMFFISSSYIFDGKIGNYVEIDGPAPANIYAETKILAEKELSKSNNSVILRVDLLYGYNGKNHPNGIIGRLLSGEDIFIGNPSQVRSPLLVDDLANVIDRMIIEDCKGIYHVAGDEKITMLNLFEDIKNKFKLKNKISILDKEKLSVKPLLNSSLNNSKIKNIYPNFTTINSALTSIQERLK